MHNLLDVIEQELPSGGEVTATREAHPCHFAELGYRGMDLTGLAQKCGIVIELAPHGLSVRVMPIRGARCVDSDNLLEIRDRGLFRHHYQFCSG